MRNAFRNNQKSDPSNTSGGEMFFKPFGFDSAIGVTSVDMVCVIERGAGVVM
jgi:hypothetical protein